MKITTKEESSTLTKTVSHLHFPMTASYAFMDYRAQGQMIPYVIVDIKCPPALAIST